MDINDKLITLMTDIQEKELLSLSKIIKERLGEHELRKIIMRAADQGQDYHTLVSITKELNL